MHGKVWFALCKPYAFDRHGRMPDSATEVVRELLHYYNRHEAPMSGEYRDTCRDSHAVDRRTYLNDRV